MHIVEARLIRKVFRFFRQKTLRLRRSGAKTAPMDLETVLEKIGTPFRSALLSMYYGELQLGADGKRHSIDNATKISPGQGVWLYDFYISVKPESSLEIGMAYGYSTLFFLAAMAENRNGTHTAVDPLEHSEWHGIGLTHAKAAGPDLKFHFIEERSDRAATDLARSNSRFDLIFIDGNHRFDDVLVDFYLFAPLCAIGGHIIFDDMWMSSIRTVVAFIRANRPDFQEVHTDEPNICVFRKTGNDLRNWDNFHRFDAHS